MRNKIFTLTVVLLAITFGTNAQKMSKEIPLSKVPTAQLKAAQSKVVKSQERAINTYDATKAAVLSEDFEGGTIPTGWAVQDGASAWTVSSDNSSDYWAIPSHTVYASINDDAAGEGGDNSDTYIATPEMDVSAFDNPAVIFDALPNNEYGGIHSVLASTDQGATWDTVQVLDGSSSWVSVTVDLIDYADVTSLMLAFHYNDEGGWMTGFAIDNVVVDELPVVEDEFAVTGIAAQYLNTVNSTVSIFAVIQNNGITEQAKTVTFNADGTEIGTATSATLAEGAIDTISIDWTPTTAGTYTVSAELVDDEDNENNSMSTTIAVASETQLAEDFEGDFLPVGWAETATETSWIQTTEFPLGGTYSTILIQSGGAAEEMLVTPPLVLDGTDTTLSYWTRGLNNTYGYGSSTLQIKYMEVGDSTWTDLGAADDYSASGDEPRLVEVDLSSLPNGNYYFAFAGTSTFDLEGYNSGIVIDDVIGPEVMPLNTITFNAANEETAEPLEGANIDITGDNLALGSMSITTDETGMAAAGLVDGDYNYSATLAGYYDTTGTVTVAGADQTIDVQMERMPIYTVTFNVTDGTDPLQDIMIIVNGEELMTDATGAANIDLSNGDYKWVATDSAYLDAFDSLTVADANATVDVTMELIPEGMVLFQDDFESYAVGDLVAENSDYWETWTDAEGGGGDDAAVSDDFANSPTKSMLIADGGADDMIFPLGEKESGLYYVSFYYYVESGADYEGYFNFQGASTPGEVFVFETYFLQDGTGTINVNGGETFNYTQDSWELVEIIVDLDNDYASFRLNGDYVTSWAYTQKLGGIDIFAGADSGTPKFYVDDISYRDLEFSGGYVTFNVTDEANEPIAGATININSSTYTTDSTGAATMLLDDGTYDYTVDTEGYVEQTGSVTVDNEDQTVDVTLIKQYAATFNLDVSESDFNPDTDILWLYGGAADGSGGIGAYDPWVDHADLKLTDPDEDLIYSVTVINIDPGDYKYQYKVTQGTPSIVDQYPEEDSLTFSIVDQDTTLNDEWVVGIEDSEDLSTFTMYPNPSTGIVTIGTEKQCEVTVTNAVGQVIMNRVVNSNEKLNLSDQTQGVYFVTAKTNQETKTLRLIIE